MKKEIMSWEVCERDFVRNVEIDDEKVKSLRKKAMKRLLRARKELVEIDFAVEDYYEVVKELLIAYLLKKGLRSQNHQCLISFFYKNNPDLEFEANLMQKMSFYRNRLNYYGEDVPKEFFSENKENFEKVIKLLFGLVNGS